jgi:hypothetical protein
VILAEHYRVLAKLRDVVEAGVRVTFVGGNHDAWAGPFLRDTVGIQLHEGPVEMTLGGRCTRRVKHPGQTVRKYDSTKVREPRTIYRAARGESNASAGPGKPLVGERRFREVSPPA